MGRLQAIIEEYPRQFWVLLAGSLVNSIASSMIWPFLTLYVRGLLDVPLASVAVLFTINAAAGLLATSVAGPLVDRFGRRRAMLAGLGGLALTLFAFSRAQTLAAWMLLMAVQGALTPLYRIGVDAMVADVTAPERRIRAYALMRMSNNAGIAIGPAVGGFVAAVSFTIAFYASSAAFVIFLLLVALFIRETLPAPHAPAGGRRTPDAGRGYGPVLRDRRFMAFFLAFTLATIPAAILMPLLAVYAKEQYGVPESQYGFIMATNALMVVLFQVAMTRLSSRFAYLPVLATGAVLYAIGVGSVALGAGFWAFWLSMVILTLGELLLAPTGSAYTANAAPPEMRGRYMGLYGLTWSAAFGLGPLLGGWLSDAISPRGPWIAGLVAGLAGAAAFLALARWRAEPARAPAAAAAEQ